jgi:hypothetical protein
MAAAVVLRAIQAGTPPSAPAVASTVADLERAFRTPPDDARIMMRWWWFGPAVTKAELEREMRLMKDGGIGGFEIQSPPSRTASCFCRTAHGPHERCCSSSAAARA